VMLLLGLIRALSTVDAPSAQRESRPPMSVPPPKKCVLGAVQVKYRESATRVRFPLHDHVFTSCPLWGDELSGCSSCPIGKFATDNETNTGGGLLSQVSFFFFFESIILSLPVASFSLSSLQVSLGARVCNDCPAGYFAASMSTLGNCSFQQSFECHCNIVLKSMDMK